MLQIAEEKIARLGYGTWGLGGDAGGIHSGYGPQDLVEARAALKYAFDSGVRYFDTAPPYGNGQSEKLLGEVFSTEPEVKVITKAGVDTWTDAPNFSGEYVRQSLHRSLNRLKRPKVEYFIFHSLKNQGLEQLSPGIEEMKSLRQEGLIDEYGISLKSPTDIAEVLDLFPDVGVLEFNFSAMDGRYLSKEVQDVISTKPGVFKIARTPLNFGFLTDNIYPDHEFEETDHRSRYTTNTINEWIRRRDQIKKLFRDYDIHGPTAELAIRYVLSVRNVDLVIPGMVSVREVEQNLRAAKFESLPTDLMADILVLNKDWGPV